MTWSLLIRHHQAVSVSYDPQGRLQICVDDAELRATTFYYPRGGIAATLDPITTKGRLLRVLFR